jgi:hypothetical protein
MLCVGNNWLSHNVTFVALPDWQALCNTTLEYEQLFYLSVLGTSFRNCFPSQIFYALCKLRNKVQINTNEMKPSFDVKKLRLVMINHLFPWNSESSGMYCRVLNLMLTDVSKACAASIIALMMEAACTSQTSVDIQLRTRQYIPEDSELHTRRRENLKSHIYFHVFTYTCPSLRIVMWG